MEDPFSHFNYFFIDTDFVFEVNFEMSYIPFDLFFSFFAFLYEFIAFFFPSFNEFLVDRLKEVKDFSFLVVCKYYIFYTYLYFLYISNISFIGDIFSNIYKTFELISDPYEDWGAFDSNPLFIMFGNFS